MSKMTMPFIDLKRHAMPASPNLSHQIREEIDEVYTFPINYDHLGYDVETSTVLVNYRDDGTATVIVSDPPGRQGYYENYPDSAEDDPVRQAKHELADELVERSETLLAGYDPQRSYWRANSGNRSLRDIYVRVDEEAVDEVILKMWQLLVEFKPKYKEYLQEHEPEEVVSPDSSLKEKVEEITGGLNQPFTSNPE
ncbi:hypothetical protein ACFQMA_01655 [Halosimplex aquaticum]|uniref:Uncharacterized protein n=1 Tax=Halosimplex aquaticum TaxID=3026162 RepID=A0ABD5XYB4_9EURY|nr:hypothetical protein [Halosimplex aquaticum]